MRITNDGSFLSAILSEMQSVDTAAYLGETSRLMIPGNKDVNWAHLSSASVGVNTGFLLVDVDNLNNRWSHTGQVGGTTEIHHLHIFGNGNAAFRGRIQLGWLSAVDGTNGDLRVMYEWTFEIGVASTGIQFNDTLTPETLLYVSDTTRTITRTYQNLVQFRTGVAIACPGGNTELPADNDLALRVLRTAGNISFDVLLGYRVTA